MGTDNFCYKDKLYVVETPTNDIQDKLTADMRQLLTELNDNLASKTVSDKASMTIKAEDEPYWSDDNNGQSYCAMNHGTVAIRSTIFDMAVELDLSVLVRNGYYDHLNIDHNSRLSCNGLEVNADYTAYDILEAFSVDEISFELTDANYDAFDKRLDDMRALASSIFNHVGTTLGTEYGQRTVGSNGEAGFAQTADYVAEYERMIFNA